MNQSIKYRDGWQSAIGWFRTVLTRSAIGAYLFCSASCDWNKGTQSPATWSVRISGVAVKNETERMIDAARVRFLGSSYDENVGSLGPGSDKALVYVVKRDRPHLTPRVQVSATFEDGSQIAREIDVANELAETIQRDDVVEFHIREDGSIVVTSSQLPK